MMVVEKEKRLIGRSFLYFGVNLIKIIDFMSETINFAFVRWDLDMGLVV